MKEYTSAQGTNHFHYPFVAGNLPPVPRESSFPYPLLPPLLFILKRFNEWTQKYPSKADAQPADRRLNAAGCEAPSQNLELIKKKPGFSFSFSCPVRAERVCLCLCLIHAASRAAQGDFAWCDSGGSLVWNLACPVLFQVRLFLTVVPKVGHV